MKKYILLFLVTVFCFSFKSELQKKILRQDGLNVECYIAVKKLKKFDIKTYHWLKSGEIHKSTAAVGGFVLHDVFTKYYRSNQLAEKGYFNYGLKDGVWKSWHENGHLKHLVKWNNGHKQGVSVYCDSIGKIILKGKYKNNLKEGYWVHFKANDTTYYKKGEAFKIKPVSLFKKVITRKDSATRAEIKRDRRFERKSDSINRVRKRIERQEKKQKDSIERIRKNKEKLLLRAKTKTKNTKTKHPSEIKKPTKERVKKDLKK